MELELGLALPINNINSTGGDFDLNDDIIQCSKKRSFDKVFEYKGNDDEGNDGCSMHLENQHCSNKLQKLPIKCRRNNSSENANSGVFLRNFKLVKVKMETVAIGRKVDLSLLNSYRALHCALGQMFPNQFCGGNNWEEDEGSRKERNYTLMYEDEEGDWMLVGDVPWESFIQSVKRLKILVEQSN